MTRTRLDVATQVLTCTRCELSARCVAPVAFSAPRDPEIAVVGEAPGAVEDERGFPFVGPAGQHLRDAMEQVRLDPAAMAFLNTVSCFPHGPPAPEHIVACAQNKADQLNCLDPTFVLLLGTVALRATAPDLSIKHGRGRPFVIDGRIHFATYHPAAALRRANFDTAMRADLERFCVLVAWGREDWMKMIPEECAGCPVEAQWWDPRGLGWCPLHLPETERPAFEARQELIAADLDALRRRAVERTATTRE